MIVRFTAVVLVAIVSVATPPPVQVELNGVHLTRSDFAALLVGILKTAGAKRVRVVQKAASDMPASSPCMVYAGRDASNDIEIVWTSATYDQCDAKTGNDEYVAAYALAALDAGFVDDPWKAIYRGTDGTVAAKRALGTEIARSFVDASERQKGAAQEQITWLRRSIRVGESRRQIYDALRSQGLVAYNYAYQRGVSDTRLKSCIFKSDAAEWPYAGEPLPKMTGQCERSGFLQKAPAFPSAEVTIPDGFNIACEGDIHITFVFGSGDLLKSMDVSKPDWECL